MSVEKVIDHIIEIRDEIESISFVAVMKNGDVQCGYHTEDFYKLLGGMRLQESDYMSKQTISEPEEAN